MSRLLSDIEDDFNDAEGPTEFSEDFQTPPDVCRYMASLINVSWGHRRILEPTPGNGNLVRAIRERIKQRAAGGRVAEDVEVVAPNDFFQLVPQRFDWVVMNPPFSARFAHLRHAPQELKRMKNMAVGYWFLERAMQMSDHVIALMPWSTVAHSDVRLRLLKRWGLKSVTLLPRKTFGYIRIQTAVFELSHGWQVATELKVFDLLPKK